MNNKKLILALGTVLLAYPSWSQAMHMFDNPHFFRANHFFCEPRFEKKGLSSLDIMASRGATKTARNATGHKVNLLSIYGPESIPGLDQSVTVPCASRFSFSGKLAVADVIILATQNIVHGFFVQMHVPFRKVEIRKIRFSSCNQHMSAELSNSLNTFLTQHDLKITPVNNTGLGDVSAYLGWTRNYQNTERIDFIDATLKLGIIAPTGIQRNESLIFDIPTGYNGHIGASMSADFSIGAYEWLTVGGHLRGIVLAAAQKCVRMKTDPCSTGFIKLACGKADVKPGSLYEGGVYIKADHIIRGLSLLFGYSRVGQGHDSLKPCGSDVPESVVMSDPMLQPWNMQTVHYLVEYDFTKEQRFICPRISLYCDQQMGGQRTFDADMTGVGFGLEIAW